jgi:hypothetical protein
VNTRTAIISLFVALAVAGGAWFFLRPAPQPPPPAQTWLRTLDPAVVASMSVQWTSGESASIERSVVPGVWVLRSGGKGGRPDDAHWPVGMSQVRGVLRLLADLDKVAPSEGKLSTPGTVVAFRMVDGAEHKLTFGEATLGGKAIILVDGPPSTLRLGDARLAGLFQDGLRAWRQSSALITGAGDASNSGEVSRVRLQTIGRQVTLGQVNGRWGVQAPVAAPADQGTCAKLLQTLGALAIQRRIEEALTDSATGLDNPTAMIDTESDFRIPVGGDIARRTLLQKLTVGGAADSAGTKLYATIRAEWKDPAKGAPEAAWGPALVTISRAELNQLSAQAPPYFSRQSVQTPAADISGFVLAGDESPMVDNAAKDVNASSRQVHIVRTLDGWRYKPDQGELRVPSTSAATQIDALVRLLVERPADGQDLQAPADTKGVARVSLESAGGAAEILGVGVAQVTPQGKPPQVALVVRNGPVFRVYIDNAADIIRWIAEELPPEG